MNMQLRAADVYLVVPHWPLQWQVRKVGVVLCHILVVKHCHHMRRVWIGISHCFHSLLASTHGRLFCAVAYGVGLADVLPLGEGRLVRCGAHARKGYYKTVNLRASLFRVVTRLYRDGGSRWS